MVRRHDRALPEAPVFPSAKAAARRPRSRLPRSVEDEASRKPALVLIRRRQPGINEPALRCILTDKPAADQPVPNTGPLRWRQCEISVLKTALGLSRSGKGVRRRVED